MSSIFRPTAPGDQPQITRLLTQAFGASPQSTLLDPRVMQWKYWEPRADWPHPRGYVMERDGQLLAHAAIWPVEFPQTGIRGVQMIDWAATRDNPGAGISLVGRLTRMFDFMYSIGGSPTARKLFPSYGFTEVTRTWMAARPLRPFRQALTHQSRNWKLAPRLVRNWWRAHSTSAPTGEWAAAPLAPSQICTAAPNFFPRSPAFFDYLSRCPVASPQLYSLSRSCRPEGHFVLTLIRGQARLAGLWLREPSDESWCAAYAVALQTARRIPGAYEFAAKGSDGASLRAALHAGLRFAGTDPVFLLDKQRVFPSVPDFQFQLIDDDGAILDIGRSDYVT